MPINTTNRKAGPFSGDDASTTFPFSFKVFSAADVYAVQADVNGDETVLALDADYTVSLNLDQDEMPGGDVVLTSALPSGESLVVTSALSFLQQTDLTNQGGFYPRVITNALDRLTILIQQLRDSVNRALKVAITSPPGVVSQLPAPVSNFLLGWNETADAIKNFAPADNTLLSAALAGPSGASLVGFLAPDDSVKTLADLASQDGASLVGYLPEGPEESALDMQTVLRTIQSTPNLYQTAMAGTPTAALSGAGVLTGVYEYACSFVTSKGETEVGGPSNSITAAANKIQLSGIPVSPDANVTARKIYRTKASGTTDVVQKFLVATLSDNITTTYLDNIADGALGTMCPRINTAGGLIKLNGARLAASGTTTTVFGYGAHVSNAGYANTALGTYSLAALTNGYRNTGVGVYALTSNTTGYENTAIGVHALNYMTTGSANTAVGYGAGMNVTTGSRNTIVGDFAALNAPGAASDNTVLGYCAIQQNIQTLGKNTVIGAQAGFSNITGYGNVFLGFQSGYRSTGNNTLVIDNQDRTSESLEQSSALLWGLFGANTSSQLLKIGGKIRSANSSVLPANLPSATQAGTEINEVGDIATSSGASTAARNAMLFYNGNGLIGIIQTSGTTTSFTSLSDRNAKTNIVDAPPAVDKLSALRVRSFDWKNSGDHVNYGLIAQEVYEVESLAVCPGTENTPWTLDASKLIPLLIKSVQELSARVRELEAR